MKSRIKTILFVVTLMAMVQCLQAQVPQKMSYQAVVKDNSNNILVNVPIGIRISLLVANPNGPALYVERHNLPTNSNGLVSLVIGDGVVEMGTLAGIPWAAGNIHIKTEIDPTGGTNYTLSGANQLLSVPYALHAQSVSSINENDPQVTSSTSNRVPKWNGISLTDGIIQDNGTGVGINTAPATGVDLAVNGKTVTSSLQVTTGATNGYVLQSNASGNAAWVNPSSLPITETDPQVNSALVGSIPRWDGSALVDGIIKDDGSAIGVGTTPVAGNKLTVSGKIGADLLKLNTGAADGYILKSDAQGNASWTNPSSLTIETDPQVASTISNRVPKWSGSSLTDGIIQDNGVGIGINTAPLAGIELNVGGKARVSNFQMTNGAAAGYLLQSSSTGNASWIDPATITFSESDPGVDMNTVSKVPRWNGNSLVDGYIQDTGVGVGLGTAPLGGVSLVVNGKTATSSIQITGGAANGYILQGNNNGDATWVSPSSVITAEIDPQVGSVVSGRVPRWNGSTLVDGFIQDSTIGIGIGTAPTLGIDLTVGGKTRTANLQITNGAANGYILQSSSTGDAAWVNPSTLPLTVTENDPEVSSVGAGMMPKWNGTTLVDSQLYDDGSNIGIGTTNPTQAKLVVNGFDTNTFANYGFLNRTTPTGTLNPGTVQNYSIYASNRIAASEFNAFSDARIKNIKGITNNKQDLETLAKIEITNYTLKDTLSKGNTCYKKVIAQQVAKVYPQAVNQITDIIPDIYKQAIMKNGYISVENNLKAGEKVKIIFSDQERILTVKEANASGFEVDLKQSGNVFVFGRQVNDFNTVDYEALSTLNISATQELLKKIEALQNAVELLKDENKTLKASISELNEMKADIENLKSLRYQSSYVGKSDDKYVIQK